MRTSPSRWSGWRPADRRTNLRHGLCRLVRPSNPQAGLWKNILARTAARRHMAEIDQREPCGRAALRGWQRRDIRWRPPRPAARQVPEEQSGPAAPCAKSAPPASQKPPAIGATTYTSRHMFEVSDVAPDTAVVRGWFIAQGCVTAVRFNGKTLSGVQLDDRKAMDAVAFIAQGRLVQKINTLEIDVSNAMPSPSQGNALLVVRIHVERDSAFGPETAIARPAARRGTTANQVRLWIRVKKCRVRETHQNSCKGYCGAFHAPYDLRLFETCSEAASDSRG